MAGKNKKEMKNKGVLTRKELIESDEYLEEYAGLWLHKGNETATIHEIRDWIKEHRREYADQFKPKWISADEPPKESAQYLVYTDDEKRENGYDVYYFSTTTGWPYSDVKLWQPLPPQPETN